MNKLCNARKQIRFSKALALDRDASL